MQVECENRAISMDIEKLFLTETDITTTKLQTMLDDALFAMDDGELFLELKQSESFVFDDGQLKTANYTSDKGFGLRAVIQETTGYAHSSDISEQAILRAVDTVKSIKYGNKNINTQLVPPFGSNKKLYDDINPLQAITFEHKLRVIQDIDRYLRRKDERVAQVSVSLSGSWQVVAIMRAGGEWTSDIRPLVRLNISVVCKNGQQIEQGSSGAGGRLAYDDFLRQQNWQRLADTALQQALTNLQSVAAPAGEMPVVLGPGWPGILLHEAVGHGLEGDFNRKKTSAFSGLLGQRVAAPAVTIIDDGTIENRRGSLTVDDEGTPTQKTILIEDGILRSYMQDRLNARLMGVAATGNGRRENYGAQPMPRMTNTYMLAGDKHPEEIIASVDKGLYAVHFGGGQVDITSGKFVFSATEAYLIENGKITAPVKGATLIGNGPDCLTKVKMIGNDMQLDSGIGTCGKAGQSVPVGVGQPTILIDPMTVGGTEL